MQMLKFGANTVKLLARLLARLLVRLLARLLANAAALITKLQLCVADANNRGRANATWRRANERCDREHERQKRSLQQTRSEHQRADRRRRPRRRHR